MNDASDEGPPEQAGEPPDGADAPESRDGADVPEDGADPGPPAGPDEDRERPTADEVESKYDFDDFGPEDMARMSYEEWDAAFDHESWITGEELLDRLEADLKSRVADRDVFAVVERIEQDGEPRLVAYSDEGYAVVHPDGTVEGSGTVLRDVKPSIALASMESYEVPEMPEGEVLPDPAEVPEGTGQLGNQLMQVIAAVHVLAGIGLFVAWIALGLPIVASVAALGFLVFGVLVFLLVANARLSDRFRAEEYRNRLRAVGMEDDERPEFLPGGDDPAGESDEDDAGIESKEDGRRDGDEVPNDGSESPGDGSKPRDDGSEPRNGGPSGTGVSSASDGGT